MPPVDQRRRVTGRGPLVGIIALLCVAVGAPALIVANGELSPVEIIVGSANLVSGGTGSFAVSLIANVPGVVATENDIAFEPPVSIPERMMVATTLAAAIDGSADHIPVADASALPDLGSVVIDEESVLYSAKDGNELVVARRGDGGTTAAAHAQGADVEVPTRVPDCVIGDVPRQAAKSGAFAYLPEGCTPGGAGEDRCRAVRAIVIGIEDFSAIASGTTLYTCAVSAGAELGEFPLSCPDGAKVPLPLQPAQASGDPDVDPNPFGTGCTDGVVHVASTLPVEIAVGSTTVSSGEQAAFGVTLHTNGAAVFATLNDVLFDSGARIVSKSVTATLAADIDADDTVIAVDDAGDLPALGVVQIDDERITYSGIEGNTLDVAERGSEGTTAAAHASGATVSAPSPLPDCRPGDGLAALDKSVLFNFVPDGCSPGESCAAVRAIVIGLGGNATIPDGTLLYECTVEGGANGGSFALSCPEGQDVEPPFQPAQASEPPEAAPLSSGCAAGSWDEITRVARGGAPTSFAGLVSAVSGVTNGCTPTSEPVSALGINGTPADLDTICPDGQVDVIAVATPTTPVPASATPTRTPTHTPTRTDTAIVSTPTTSPQPTTTPTVPAGACAGDCDESGAVTIDELIRSVRIGLATLPLAECPSVDANDSQHATIDELVSAVQSAIEGCPP